MNILPFSAWYPELNKISSPDDFFGTVKECYTQYHQEGYFKKSTQKVVLIYQIATTTGSYIGLLATIPTSEYLKGNILKHEKTLARKEEKTIQLIVERQANVKPILLTYPSVDSINEVLQKYVNQQPPSYTTYFEAEQARHSIWAIENTSLVRQLQDLFNQSVDSLFIADGHHRTSTMSRLYTQNSQLPIQGDFSQLLVALFGSNQLSITAFNRIVKASSSITPAQFLKATEQYCTIEYPNSRQLPTQKHTFGVQVGEHWCLLTWKKEVIKSYASSAAVLDVQLLNDKILSNILGIADVQTDKRIKYVPSAEGIDGLLEAMSKNPDTIGFYLHPIRIEDLMNLVNQQQLLPPKSTYFEPRMKNGLVVRRF